MFSYSLVCQLSTGSHNITHDKVVTKNLFFPPIFLSKREGAWCPHEQVSLRSTHGCKQPVPFPRQAAWSRKTPWHCHTLHTACCFWGTGSHNPWEEMVWRKQTKKHCLRAPHGNCKEKKQQGSQTQTLPPLPARRDIKKSIASKIRLYQISSCKWRNRCSNAAAVREECYLVAHGFAVLSVVNGHTHQPPVFWGHWAWAWRQLLANFWMDEKRKKVSKKTIYQSESRYKNLPFPSKFTELSPLAGIIKASIFACLKFFLFGHTHRIFPSRVTVTTGSAPVAL